MRPPSRIVASVAGAGIIFVFVSGLAAAEVAASAKHCLWRVTNARTPFYLLGSAIYGVDNHVAEMARRYSKRTGGVETVDEHVHVFSDMHMVEEEVYLLQALIHAAEASPQFQLDVAAWKSGDTNRLYAMHVRRMKEAPTVWWRVLDQRNAKWIPKA